jgi:tetratricopeptide (TPR) repeat protein
VEVAFTGVEMDKHYRLILLLLSFILCLRSSALDEIALQNAMQEATVRPLPKDQHLPKLAAIVKMYPEEMAERADEWMQPLMDVHRFSNVAAMSQQIIEAIPWDTKAIMKVQAYRARALLYQGAWDRALFNAKGMFNIATLDKHDDAINLMDECLKDARLAKDPEIIQRFNAEQVTGALPPTTQPAGAAPASKPATVLQSITCGDQYRAMLRRAVEHVQGTDYKAFAGCGNLYLLADQPVEAKKYFERAYQIAPPEALAEATENLARVMKAEDGGIGRANAWLNAQKAKK